MINHLKLLYGPLPLNAKVLDVGCVGFAQVRNAHESGRTDLKHFGVDYGDLDFEAPAGYLFKKADLNSEPIPFADDTFDLVVASHIIEHLANPLVFFEECIRVTKPGGILYVEAPSERSLLLPGMPFKFDEFYSLSFFDDPTHSHRPWSPQSLHRLTRYYSCVPIKAGYYTSWRAKILYPLRLVRALLTKNGRLLESSTWQAVGWVSYLVARKPIDLKGKPAFRYYIPH